MSICMALPSTLVCQRMLPLGLTATKLLSTPYKIMPSAETAGALLMT